MFRLDHVRAFFARRRHHRRRRGRIWHKGHRTPYHVENSRRGIEHAAALGYRYIDLDWNITADGFLVNTHWPRPMMRDKFRDPARKLRRWRTVRSMKLAEALRLRAPAKHGPPYRISTLDRAMQSCAQFGVGMMAEPKGDPRFRDHEVWVQFKKAADFYGVPLRMYTLRHPGSQEVIDAAHAAGIPGHHIGE